MKKFSFSELFKKRKEEKEKEKPTQQVQHFPLHPSQHPSQHVATAQHASQHASPHVSASPTPASSASSASSFFSGRSPLPVQAPASPLAAVPAVPADTLHAPTSPGDAASGVKIHIRGMKEPVVKEKKGKHGKGKGASESADVQFESSGGDRKVLDTYEYKSKDIPIIITISRIKGEFVPIYDVSIASISKTTEFILEKIRQELIRHVTLGMLDITDTNKAMAIEEKFTHAISLLIEKYFPDVDEETKKFLVSYLIAKSLGLGNLDLLLNDQNIEEIVVNQSGEPIWVYHRKQGWLKTNIVITDEDQIRHYANVIARRVGRQITVLEPLLDAHLNEGDRVNATLNPISSKGNTITMRKFSRDPWTITKYLMQNTISYDAAALVWTAIQYELSALIAGGTASGKTSTLNCLANFFPPNQRIISIEDTRELQLPKYLHWVPLSTRLPNAEGKGSISMEDLLVNSLRMRPDRILVGEVRRQREAETLFEAIHTGHSCYATFHANSAEETITRLTHAPINVPEMMLPAISLILMQFRNRRTGTRRTFQVAEVTGDGKANILMQYDPKKDTLANSHKSKSLMATLHTYTGMSPKEMKAQLNDKVRVMKYLVSNKILDVDQVGRIMGEYYTNEDYLMKVVKANRKFSF